MGIADYIIVCAVAAALGAAIAHTIKKRRRGDFGCGGCMGDCSSCIHTSCIVGERNGKTDKNADVDSDADK